MARVSCHRANGTRESAMLTTSFKKCAVPSEDSLPFLQLWKEDKKNKSSWVAEFRRKGYARYSILGGIPTSKIESWKYTSLKKLDLISYKQEIEKGILSSFLWPSQDGLLTIPGPQFVLVNGCFAPQLSSSPLSDGLIVQSLEEALRYDESIKERLLSPERLPAMAALNAAWLGDGLVVRFKANPAENNIVHVVFVSTNTNEKSPNVTHPCIIVIVEGRATLIESHMGMGAALTNMVSYLYVEPNATLTHVRAQSGLSENHAICSSTATVASKGLYQCFVLTTGLGLVRNELTVTLAEPEAECRLYGAYTADSNRHVDNTIVMNHIAPATTSRQIFKGVLADGGRGVFQGRISIHPQAQKSDGHQIHRALLLSPGAEAYCKPELEISADNVKCTHGATAGELDEEILFYLRARGLDAETARALLIESFLSDVVNGVSFGIPRLPDVTRAMVSVWLAGRVPKPERF